MLEVCQYPPNALLSRYVRDNLAIELVPAVSDCSETYKHDVIKTQMKEKHITDPIEPSGAYNERLADDASEASPAGKQDAAIPTDPQPNWIVSEKDGINYFSEFDSQAPRTVLDVIDSTAGHEAIHHTVCVETYAAARRLFAALVETQCLIETVVDIHYLEDSKVVEFEPADRTTHYHEYTIVQLFVDRYSDGVDEQADPDNETETEAQGGTKTERSTEIETEELYGFLRCWIANTTTKTPPSNATLARILSSLSGIEKVARAEGPDGRQTYWRLFEGGWDFDRA